jgi:transcriptional regulator with XRE-family HTH domain
VPERDRGAGRVVAANLRALRANRGWSLDRLAGRAGVSKGVLVALEADRGNPSLNTLCRLADAFGVSLTELVDAGAAPALRVAAVADAVTLWHGPHGGTGRLVLSTDPPHPVELWWWELEPGEVRRSEPHAVGTREAVLVLAGEVTVDSGAHRVSAAEGTAVALPGDEPHVYGNTGPVTARMVLLVTVPR